MKNCLLWEKQQGKSVKSPSPEEGAVVDTMCDEQAAIPVLRPPTLLRSEEVDKIGNEVQPEKEGRVGRGCFKIWFYFLLSCSDVIGKIIKLFPQSNLF